MRVPQQKQNTTKMAVVRTSLEIVGIHAHTDV